MDRLFFDTNVLLDALAVRTPFFDDALAALALVEAGQAEGAFSGLSLATLDYVLKTMRTSDKLVRYRELRRFLAVAPLASNEVDQALKRGLPDFEDGLQLESARAWGATHLLTRNVKDFPVNRSLKIIPPAAYLAKRPD